MSVYPSLKEQRERLVRMTFLNKCLPRQSCTNTEIYFIRLALLRRGEKEGFI